MLTNQTPSPREAGKFVRDVAALTHVSRFSSGFPYKHGLTVSECENGQTEYVFVQGIRMTSDIKGYDKSPGPL